MGYYRTPVNDRQQAFIKSINTELDGYFADLERRAGSELPLRVYYRAMWSIINPKMPYESNLQIDVVADHVEAVTFGQLRNLIINIPARHGKSTLIAVARPSWEWTEWPERRWLFASYAASLSIRDSVFTRNVIQSPWYQVRRGNVFKLVSDQNEKHRFENE
jgi:hypothetical protein